MKIIAMKIEQRVLYSFTFLILVVCIISSCKNTPIFAAIEEEVKLNEQTVQGLISGIVRVGDVVYSANPKNVFKKDVGQKGKWEKIETPGGMCTSLATDGNALYASFMGKGVYSYNGAGWDVLQNAESIVRIVSGRSIIGVDVENMVFSLVSSSFSKMKDVQGNDVKLASTLHGAGNYFSDLTSIYSYNATGVATKLTLSDIINIRDLVSGDDASKIFILTPQALFHYDGSSLTSAKHKVLSPWSASYSSVQKTVLIGGSQGYNEVKLKNPATLTDAYILSPGTAGFTTPPSCFNQYNNSVGKWLIRPILIIDYSDGYVIYVGVGGENPKYTGLWGFYNPAQLEWNRE